MRTNQEPVRPPTLDRTRLHSQPRKSKDTDTSERLLSNTGEVSPSRLRCGLNSTDSMRVNLNCRLDENLESPGIEMITLTDVGRPILTWVNHSHGRGSRTTENKESELSIHPLNDHRYMSTAPLDSRLLGLPAMMDWNLEL